jgi:hypothetical protein|tara:strand:- start:124 stop:612 length:489 start_codon:yes stop_codon:yes gene_type:complete
MKNTVQIYGLPRSGTNFLEWSIINNFYNIVYNAYTETPEIKELPRPKVAAKHQMPSFKHSDKIIVIYKKWNAYIKSYKRWDKNLSDENIIKGVYDSYLQKAKSLDSSKTIIFEHSWLVENYEQGMKIIEEKFDLKMKDKIVQPKNRLNSSRHITDQIYVLEK